MMTNPDANNPSSACPAKPEARTLIRYADVSVSQPGHLVLEHVDLRVRAGEFVYLIGKVGSGKTSLLRTLYGELDVEQGRAEVLGFDLRTLKARRLPDLRRRMGIVFQDFQLLTDRTAADNLDFVLRAIGYDDARARSIRIDEVLDQVGMPGKGYKMPHELSGGEQQRVAIARALLGRPELIVADEPTGNLDEDTGRQITRLLHDISHQGTAVVMTTHNLQWIEEFPATVYRCESKTLKKEIDCLHLRDFK